MTFMLSEDKALRELLQGLTVHDQKADGSVAGARSVGVWFGQPDQEIRSQTYPYITINLLDVQRDFTREMRGKTNVEYLKPADLDEDKDFSVDIPIPVDLEYQITAYSRHPRQDRELMTELLFSRLPFRFGTLNLDDGTVRRLDVLDVTKRDFVEQGKRLFLNAITVRVSSEMVQRQIKELYKVLEIHGDPVSAERADRLVSPGTYLITAD
jgi:hypothetical protein